MQIWWIQNQINQMSKHINASDLNIIVVYRLARHFAQGKKDPTEESEDLTIGSCRKEEGVGRQT